MPSDKNSIIEKAQKLAAKGQLDKAIEEWQKLIAETPNDGNIFNTIGDLHLKANHTKEAVVAYLKAAEVFKAAGFELKSIAVFKKIIKIDPSRMDVYEKLADVHAERGLTGNAIEDYLRVAKHHSKAGDIRAALSVYRKLANLDPQNADVRLKIAEMCQKEGLAREAVEEYEKVLTLYEAQKKVTEIEEVRRQILLVDPSYKSAQPLPDFLPVVEEPVPAVAAPIPISERMAETIESGEWERAEPILEELSGQPHELFLFLSQWIDQYIKKESLPKAFMLLQKAVFIADENSFIEEGRSLIVRYLEQAPRQISAHQLLGQSLEKVGKVSEARDCYSKILSLLTEQGQAEQAKNYYERLKTTLPSIAEIDEWKSLFEPEEAPLESPLIEVGLEEIADHPPNEPLLASAPEIVEIGALEDILNPDVRLDQSIPEELAAPGFQIKEPSIAPVIPEISEATLQGHLTEAEVYIKYGLHSKAIDQLKMISELAPSREEPHLQLKELYLKEGQIPEAVAECRTLARIYEKENAVDKKTAILAELSRINVQPAESSGGFRVEAESPSSGVISLKEESHRELPPNKKEVSLSEREEIDLPIPEQENDLQGIQEKMVQVENHLQKGEKDAAKKLLWKIMEENSSYTEARLKLLEIQELSQKEMAPLEAPLPDIAQRGASQIAPEETSFEGLSEALDKSFSDLLSNETSESSLAGATDETSQQEGSEDYVDLTSIFSEEIHQEEDDEETINFSGIGLEDAFKQLQKGAQGQMNQEEFETHYNLGIAYKEMGLIPEGIKEFELAFQGDLRFVDASIMLAHCYQLQGMIDTGVEILVNGLEDPRCNQENLLALKYELASLFYQKGMHDKAAALYDEIYRLDPQFRDISAKVESFESAPVPAAPEEVKPKRPSDTKKKDRVSYL